MKLLATGTRSPDGRRSAQAAFTLIELTVAIAISLMVSSAALAMLSQHFSFLRIMESFEFLRTEAPQINSMVNRLAMKASSYRIHQDKEDAFNRTRAVNTDGRALRLIFRNPDGSVEENVIAFEDVNDERQLNFYFNKGSGWSDSPSWSISRRASDVTFDDSSGIVLMTLNGPAQEQVVYAATTE